MSDSAGEKTLDPTAKKLADARKKGEVAIAPEIRQTAMFAAMLAVVVAAGPPAAARIAAMAAQIWGNSDLRLPSGSAARQFAAHLLGEFALILALPLALLLAGVVVGALAQGPLLVRWARLAPKWKKLVPWTGLARLFGPRALVEFAKTLVKFAAVGGVGLWLCWPLLAGLDHLVAASPLAVAALTWGLAVRLLLALTALIACLALADYLWQQHSHGKQLRMSHQDVRDEHKSDEGDPLLKARVRAIQRSRARQRMMADVPMASVVITNPTHFAIALRYDHGAMAAPVIVAMGVDLIALKIREVAGAAGVPMVESPPLARALYATGAVGQPIAVDHYAAVAAIISAVMAIDAGAARPAPGQ